MYLNACVPRLQWERGVVTFFERHLGQPVASSALMAPRTRDFVAAIERFIKARALPVVEFRKGQRKDDVVDARGPVTLVAANRFAGMTELSCTSI